MNFQLGKLEYLDCESDMPLDKFETMTAVHITKTF